MRPLRLRRAPGPPTDRRDVLQTLPRVLTRIPSAHISPSVVSASARDHHYLESTVAIAWSSWSPSLEYATFDLLQNVRDLRRCLSKSIGGRTTTAAFAPCK